MHAKKTLLFICVMLMCFSVLITVSADDEAVFSAHSFETAKNDKIGYWMFEPKNARADMPLVVYLHGGSGRGSDVNALKANGLCKWVSEGKI